MAAVKRTLWVLMLTLSAQAQNARPDFTGVWQCVSITLGPPVKSVTEIKQTDVTIALRPVIAFEPSMEWFIYSTDGKVMRTKTGRHVIERTGHWEGNQLVLQDAGPSDTPWRRSTEQRTLTLSSDGRRMTMKIHNLSDKKSVHDYAIESDRVKR